MYMYSVYILVYVVYLCYKFYRNKYKEFILNNINLNCYNFFFCKCNGQFKMINDRECGLIVYFQLIFLMNDVLFVVKSIFFKQSRF